MPEPGKRQVRREDWNTVTRPGSSLRELKRRGNKKEKEEALFIGGENHVIAVSDTDNYYGPSHFSKATGKRKGNGGRRKKGAKSSKSAGYQIDDYYLMDDATMPPTVVSAHFVQSVGCYTDGACVYSHNPDFGSEYQMEDSCTWTVTDNAVLAVEYFALEDGFDTLTIAGVAFTGTGEGLDGFPVFAGDTLFFSSDFMGAAPGFKVCLMNPF